MLALSTGCLLTLLSLLQNSNTLSFFQDGTPDILAVTRQVLTDWNYQKIRFVSKPLALHAAHLPSTIPGRGGQVSPGPETSGHAQIANVFGTPFMLEGLFGEADAEAMDADPDLEPSAHNIGMDVEDDAESGPAVGGTIVDDDIACVPHPTPTLFPAVK